MMKCGGSTTTSTDEIIGLWWIDILNEIIDGWMENGKGFERTRLILMEELRRFSWFNVS